MNEPTEIKYSLDENGEPYFAATHKKAVQGMETVETNIEDLMNFKETVIGDTGWVDFEFIPEVDKNTRFGDDGFKCGLKEVRFGDVRIKSIRLNINNVPHNQQIAYIPTGFVTKNHYFNSSTDGNSLPIRVEMRTNGELKIYVHENDRSKLQKDVWVYQQFTWLE
ncbi:hypothetical protein [Staphylococcus cohnii]|uniref:hypothetical protein n=1 Tax=Staphylococcus cohnii TaxID=29382 RepID=UPI00119E49B9|nr:hypothetical protein [Staphylococcus cohnii]